MNTPRAVRGLFLFLASLAGAGYLLGSEPVKLVALCAFNLVVLVAVTVRASRERPGHPARVTCVGFAIYTVASFSFFLTQPLTGHALPYPSVVDGGLFLSYGCFLAMSWQVARRRGRTSNGALDTAIVLLATSAPLWQFVIGPSLDSHLPLAATLTTLTYPTLLLVLVVLALRLVFFPNFRGAPDLFILGWLAGEFTANVSLAVSFAHGDAQLFSPWYASLIVSWTFLGMLALWPAPRSATAAATRAQGPRQAPRHARRRLILLTGALMAPVLTLALSHPNGNYALLVTAALAVGIMARLSVVTVDLDEQRGLLAQTTALGSELARQASHDPLTGLPNRTLLADRLDVALAQRSTGAGRGVVLLLLDLDGFKVVNDTHGHEIGDELLTTLAATLTAQCRHGDTVARLGGDEFAVVLPNADLAEALRCVYRISNALLRPVTVAGRELIVTACVGIVVAGGQDRSTLLRQADIAMYAGKAKGAGNSAVFDADLHADVLARNALELELRGAADRGELVLEYQPVLHLRRHQMVAVEALVRWDHPIHGRIPPLAFIPIAERSGSIRQIGEWVLETACAQVLAWDREHPGIALDVAVNLSPRQLLDHDLVGRIEQVLLRSPLQAHRITLEVTESALVADPDADLMITKLGQLKKLGVRLAIDDFGTGMSSLSFLRRLPVDILKVDRSFVTGIARDSEAWAVTSAIIKLAVSLGKQTLAEGIELGEQLAHLRALHCEFGQGYLFDRPLPPELISERLNAMASVRTS